MNKALKELCSPTILRFPDDGGVEYVYTEEQVNIISNGLQALEIIKESIPIEGEDFFYDSEFDTYLFIGHKVSKEQFDLLKEVLLCRK